MKIGEGALVREEGIGRGGDKAHEEVRERGEDRTHVDGLQSSKVQNLNSRPRLYHRCVIPPDGDS